MSTQWVNAGPDEAALPALLGRVAHRILIESIDELWIFATRRAQGVESTVIVVSTFDPSSPREAGTVADADHRDRKSDAGQGEVGSAALADSEGRRRIYTAHFTATRDRKGRASVDEKIELQAIAPADAAARVVGGVIRRLDDGLALPRSERIVGDAERWAALLEALQTPRTPPLTPAGGD